MRLTVRTLTLALLLPAFAGCLDTAPDDGLGPDHEGAGSIVRSGVPTEAMLDERSLDAHPTWHVGEWWRVAVGGSTGHAYDATVVVAGERDGHIMLGMPADDFSDVAVGGVHLPPTGPMRAIDLSWYFHDGPFPMADFPLEEGKTWNFDYRGGQARAEVVEANDDQAVIHVTHPSFDFELTYDARMGFMTEIVFEQEDEAVGDSPASLLLARQRVTHHGFGFEGEVIVPDDLQLAILEGGLGPMVDEVEVDVDPGRDTMSLAFFMGEATEYGAGSYRVAVTAPNGTTYERTFDSTGGEPQFLDGVNIKDPAGTWTIEFGSVGTGATIVEAIAYNAMSYELGPGN